MSDLAPGDGDLAALALLESLMVILQDDDVMSGERFDAVFDTAIEALRGEDGAKRPNRADGADTVQHAAAALLVRLRATSNSVRGAPSP